MTGCSLLLNTGNPVLLNTGNELELNLVCGSLVTFNGGGTKIRKPKRQIQIYKVSIPLRITSKLNIPVEIRSVLRGKLRAENITTININSSILSKCSDIINLKSSLNDKLTNEFTLKGQQSYQKLYDAIKLLTEMDE